MATTAGIEQVGSARHALYTSRYVFVLFFRFFSYETLNCEEILILNYLDLFIATTGGQPILIRMPITSVYRFAMCSELQRALVGPKE